MSDKKVWLITGCSSGIGDSIARKALQNGSLVAATVRNTDDITDLKDNFGDSVINFKIWMLIR